VTWTPDAPRYRLLDGPSPLHRLPRFSAALDPEGGIDIWVKREDLLPLGLGGNKLRNLEFHVGAALAAGADTLITSGRRWSNHCRLTAAAGAKAGLAVHLVLTGPRGATPGATPGANERLDGLLGAEVHVTASDERSERAALVERIATDLRRSGHRPYVIEVGGSDPIGAIGQVLAGIELAEQVAELGLEPVMVVLPTATGGTQAGLLVGMAVAGLRSSVVGVAVAHPAAEVRPGVDGLVDALAKAAGVGRTSVASVTVVDPARPTGYGRSDPSAESALALLARTEGIFVDPIYTAKALAWLVDEASAGRIRGTVVFWHAGGVPGLFETLDR
jgi:1-aminocyclopropane-1-carboxylate deaminase/D-cysteine desulfhydrase-like pyridoxal-dependent ACC family enzyme